MKQAPSDSAPPPDQEDDQGPEDHRARARLAARHHYARAAAIGACAGLLAVAFRRALFLAESTRANALLVLHGYPAWGWIVLPVLGLALGCAVGWCTRRYAPEAGGSGIPHLKGVMSGSKGPAGRALIPVKFLGGAACIGAGLSLGREGPTVQMGAMLAALLAPALRAPPADLPPLLSAGAGAGLAAAFNAPLAGLLFAVEELQRKLSPRTAIGCLMAAVCATVVAQDLVGETPSFELRGLAAMPLADLPVAVLVGIIGGLGGVVFNRSLLGAQDSALRQTALPGWALPGAVGALAGLVAWWCPDALGGGHGVAERVLGGKMALGLGSLVFLLLLKYAMTVLSYASGAPGGIFAPMLLLGALCGSLLASVLAMAAPAWAVKTQVLSVLGMAAFFVGSVRAPLTGIVLISEMTGRYRLLFPICVASLVAYLTADGLGDEPIYDALLHADLKRTRVKSEPPVGA